MCVNSFFFSILELVKKKVGLGAAFIPLNNALERATSRMHWLLAQARMLTYADVY